MFLSESPRDSVESSRYITRDRSLNVYMCRFTNMYRNSKQAERDESVYQLVSYSMY